MCPNGTAYGKTRDSGYCSATEKTCLTFHNHLPEIRYLKCPRSIAKTRLPAG
jgi:hypothetical protein